MSRLSLKSLIGNILVIITACLTYTFKAHEYLPSTPRILEVSLPGNITYAGYLLVCLLIPFFSFVISGKKSFKSTLKLIWVLISYLSLFSIGVFYAFSLMYGGFVRRKTVYENLNLNESWNPSMVLIYGYGVVGCLIVYIFMRFVM